MVQNADELNSQTVPGPGAPPDAPSHISFIFNLYDQGRSITPQEEKGTIAFLPTLLPLLGQTTSNSLRSFTTAARNTVNSTVTDKARSSQLVKSSSSAGLGCFQVGLGPTPVAATETHSGALGRDTSTHKSTIPRHGASDCSM